MTPRICECWQSDPRINCDCERENVLSEMEQTDRFLPFLTQSTYFTTENNEVQAQIKNNVAIQLHVQLEELKIALKIDNTHCEIKDPSIVGCYNCLTGARFTYRCITTFGTALAEIRCGNVITTTPCDTIAQAQHIHMHFHSPKVSENCSVICPGGENRFFLEGHLNFVELEPLFGTGLANSHRRLHESTGIDPAFILNWIYGNMGRIIAIIAAIAAAVLSLYCVGQFMIFRAFRL
ncbi:phlebovirus glycoprotein g2 domain-containing protein [Ditylenchus destructor]|nr:phlebovirus glycoprotein g2 domain-containing protein [Ditylenchus destructor]